MELTSAFKEAIDSYMIYIVKLNEDKYEKFEHLTPPMVSAM